jgi:hypothetical protein
VISHGTAAAFWGLTDRSPQFRVGRVTWDQMRDEPEGVVARIAAALRAGG